MNKQNILFWLCLLLMPVAACSDMENETPVPGGEGIIFRYSMGTGTRATELAFEQGDTIMVNATKKSDMVGGGNPYYAEGIIYTYQEGVGFVSDTPIYYPNDGDSLSFSAICPHTAYYCHGWFEVMENQNDGNNYMQSDLMTATTGFTRDESPVLAFSHIFSSVLLSVTNECEGLTISGTYLCGICPHANGDWENGYASNDERHTDIRMKAEAGNTSFKAVFPPQTIPGDSVLIRIEAEGHEPLLIKTAKDLSFSSGVRRVYNLRITSDGELVINGETDDIVVVPTPTVTKLPDITGLWTCTEEYSSGGTTTYTLTLNEDGTLVYSECETPAGTSWSIDEGGNVRITVHEIATSTQNSATEWEGTVDNLEYPMKITGTTYNWNYNNVGYFRGDNKNFVMVRETGTGTTTSKHTLDLNIKIDVKIAENPNGVTEFNTGWFQYTSYSKDGVLKEYADQTIPYGEWYSGQDSVYCWRDYYYYENYETAPWRIYLYYYDAENNYGFWDYDYESTEEELMNEFLGDLDLETWNKFISGEIETIETREPDGESWENNPNGVIWAVTGTRMNITGDEYYAGRNIQYFTYDVDIPYPDAPNSSNTVKPTTRMRTPKVLKKLAALMKRNGQYR